MYLKLSRHVHIVYNFATFQFYGITGIGIGLKNWYGRYTWVDRYIHRILICIIIWFNYSFGVNNTVLFVPSSNREGFYEVKNF